MKQVGIMFFVMAVLGTLAVVFQLRGLFWDTLITLIVMATSAFVPGFKRVLAWKFHWRLALVIGVVSTFTVTWQLMRRLLSGYPAYSLAATLFVFGLLAFLFHYLDTWNANVEK